MGWVGQNCAPTVRVQEGVEFQTFSAPGPCYIFGQFQEHVTYQELLEPFISKKLGSFKIYKKINISIYFFNFNFLIFLKTF